MVSLGGRHANPADVANQPVDRADNHQCHSRGCSVACARSAAFVMVRADSDRLIASLADGPPSGVTRARERRPDASELPRKIWRHYRDRRVVGCRSAGPTFDAFNALYLRCSPRNIALMAHSRQRPGRASLPPIWKYNWSVCQEQGIRHYSGAKNCRVAAILMPRFNKGERMTPTEVAMVHQRLRIATELTHLLALTIEIAEPTEPIQYGRWRELFIWMTASPGNSAKIMQLSIEQRDDDMDLASVSKVLAPWGKSITECWRTVRVVVTTRRVMANMASVYVV